MSKIETARNRIDQLRKIARDVDFNLDRYGIEPTDRLFQQIEDAIHAVERVRAEVRRLRDEQEEEQ